MFSIYIGIIKQQYFYEISYSYKLFIWNEKVGYKFNEENLGDNEFI